MVFPADLNLAVPQCVLLGLQLGLKCANAGDHRLGWEQFIITCFIMSDSIERRHGRKEDSASQAAKSGSTFPAHHHHHLL